MPDLRGRRARIFRPARSAMQSGRGLRAWILEFEPELRPVLDPLMGWDGCGDVVRQNALRFATCEEAVNYARMHAIDYTVSRPPSETSKPKSYSDNFRYEARDRPRFPH